MPSVKFINQLHLHFLVFIAGFTAILGEFISINAIALVWFRMAIAAVMMFGYIKIKRVDLKIPFKTILKFFVAGIIIALHWITFFKAIKVSNVSVALVAMSTGAFFTSLIEPFFFKRKIKTTEIFLGLMVIGGLYIIFSFESQYTLGIVYALISSFLAALFSVLNGLFIRKYNASIISLYQLFFGAIFITLFLFFQGSFSISFFILQSSDWIYLLILSSICTAYAFIVSVDVMKHLTPYTVMLTVNLEPVYAIILALIIFGESEKMNSEFYLGAGIVLFVVLLNGILKNMKSIANKVGKLKQSKK